MSRKFAGLVSRVLNPAESFLKRLGGDRGFGAGRQFAADALQVRAGGGNAAAEFIGGRLVVVSFDQYL